MRNKPFILLIFFAVNLVFSLASQANEEAADPVLTAETYFIYRIYSHRLGYRIDYFDVRGELQTLYTKASWYNDISVRREEIIGEMVVDNNYPSPYLVVLYKNGEVYKFTIYTRDKSRSFGTWAVFPSSKNIDDKFDIQSLDLKRTIANDQNSAEEQQ